MTIAAFVGWPVTRLRQTVVLVAVLIVVAGLLSTYNGPLDRNAWVSVSCRYRLLDRLMLFYLRLSRALKLLGSLLMTLSVWV